VEFGDAKNRSVVIKTIRQTVRGHFSLRKFYETDQGGRDVGPSMQRVPDIPGLFMCVSPKDDRAIIYDPWEKKPEMWDKLNGALRGAHAARGGKYGPVERSEMTLSKDQIKTLCLEMIKKVEGGVARVVKGTLPTLKQVQSMPGRELYDTMNSGRKPRYVDEVAGWEQRLDSTTG
jgi:hypothetical protein